MSQKFHLPTRVSGIIPGLLDLLRRNPFGFFSKPVRAAVFLFVTFLCIPGSGLQAQNPACEPCQLSKKVTLPIPPPAQFLSKPKDITIPCNAAPPVGSKLSYSNNSKGECTISGTVTGVIEGSHDICGGSYTETWTFTDECDRTIMLSRTITVLPAPKASFVSLPKNTTIPCSAAPPKGSKLSYTNGGKGGCIISGTVTGVIEGSHDICGGEYTETWTFTDECDRTITHSRTIFVNPAPQATFTSMPGNMTISCAAAPPQPTSLNYSNSTHGLCSISGSVMSTITGSHDECGGSYTETWTFTDPCHRTITHSRTITVTPAPEAYFVLLPQNTSLPCSAAPPVPSTLAYTNGATGICLISGSVLSSITGSHNECGGSYTETWTFTDRCGRTITHMRTITVNPAPAAAFTSLPGNMTIDCNQAPPAPTSLSYTNGETGVCEISGSVTSSINGSHNECGGSYTETWTFTDRCGRTITHTRTITVNPAPAAAFTSLPGNMTINCNQAPPAPTSLSYTNGETGVCEISGSVTSSINGSHDECGGSYTETWTFTDRCGRTITHTRTITVNPAPAAAFTSLPGNMTINCNQAPPAPTSLSYTNGETGVCEISGSVTSSINGSHDECGGSYTETWTFTDRCGRTITHTRTITVNPAPAAAFTSLPGNMTIDCNQAPPAPTSLSYTNGETGVCEISGSVTSSINGSHDECGGSYTETWTFTDRCGRTISHTRTITVNPAPAAAFTSLPGNMAINCNQAPPAPTSLSYTNGETGVCEISGSVISSINGSHDECGGSYTETWTFTDRCGRTITHMRTITVNPAPAAAFTSLPGNMTINCNQAPPAPTSLSYTNGETGVCEISGSVTSSINGSHDECGGSYTETWTFTDRCGRTISHTRTITVNPAPAAAFTSLPGNMTINCNQAPPAPTSLSYTNGETGVCEISGSVTSSINGSHDECGGSYTETWTFTDRCGRTITHTRTITVNPAPAAAFTSLPGNITIECATTTPPSNPLAYTNGETGVCEISGSVNSTLTLLNEACPRTYTETWTFTDNCGRTITHSRIVTVTFFWQNSNLGAANGSAQYSCNGPAPGAIGPVSLTSVGYGSSMADIMHFIYTYLDGDGQIIAQLNGVSNQGFAGIMIRESLAPGSKKTALRRQNSLFNVQREIRTMTNGQEITQQWPRVHRWLRIDRIGNVFAAYTSPDGVNWWSCPSNTTVVMNSCVLIGVFVEGINVNTPATAVFDFIRVTQGTPQPLTAPQTAAIPVESPSEVSPFDLQASPNPVSSGGELRVELFGVMDGNVRIGLHSLQGALIKEVVVDASLGSNVNIGLNGVPAGTYFIRAMTQDGNAITRKIVVLNK